MDPSGPFLMFGGRAIGPPIMCGPPLLGIMCRGMLFIGDMPGMGPLICGRGPRAMFRDPGEPKLGGPFGPLASPLAEGVVTLIGGGGGGAPAACELGGSAP